MQEVLVLKETIGTIKSPADLFGKIKKLKIDYKQENFILFSLDTKNKLIGVDILFKGGLNGCIIDPKTLFRTAIKHNANSFIVAHNHPSGDLCPSFEDNEVFQKFKDAGNILMLNCLDSIIFNDKEFYAMEGK